MLGGSASGTAFLSLKTLGDAGALSSCLDDGNPGIDIRHDVCTNFTEP